MKIAVIGAGIVGICTAYELAQDGHEVSIYERNASVAQEASFACAGHLSPSLAHALAFPSLRTGSWLRSLASSSNLTVRPGVSLRDLAWLYRWKLERNSYPEKRSISYGLATYSLARLQALRMQSNLVYEQSRGHLLLWNTEAAMARHQAHLASMKELGLSFQTLTPEQSRTLEPALQAEHAFFGATYFPSDEIGNCREFAHLLKERLSQLGANFHFAIAIKDIRTAAGVEILCANGEAHAVDHVVVCTGTATDLFNKLNKALPLTTVWSHSLSAPIREPLNAPRSAVQDAHSQISVSRLGSRVRVAGGAELGSASQGDASRVVKQLYQTLSMLFPVAADFSRSVQNWSGSSQFTPDGLPIVGPSGSPGLWLNVGHGHNGWSMACGCARVIADLIAGKQAELDTSYLQAHRFKT